LSSTTAKPSRGNPRLAQTFVYYAGFIALGMFSASLGPTLPGLAEHTRSQLSQISYLFTARSLGYLLGSMLGGRLYDRKAGHVVMAIVLTVMVAMIFLTPVVPLLWLLVLVMLLLGIGEGGFDVGGNTMLMWFHRDKVGPYMNGLHFFFGVGAFVSPIIIAQLVLKTGDIRIGYWVLALLALPVIFALLRFPSPTNVPVAGESHKAKMNYGIVSLIVLFFLLYVGAEVSFGGWIYTYAFRQGMFNETTAAYLTSTFWGSLTLGRLFSIPIATRFKPQQMLGADLVICALSVGLILLLPHSAWVTWVGTFGAGFGMSSIFPTMLVLAQDRMHITGQVTSWFFIGASAGGMLLPWLIGQLFEKTGPLVTMIAIFSDVLLAGVVFVVLLIYSQRVDRKSQVT
jgi:MFS transporter, FHS family, Na+ dependent glucose transporter 1